MSLSKGEALEFAGTEAHSFGQLHEVGGRVGAGTEDEDDGTERRALLKDGFEADDWRHDVLLSHHT